MAAGLSAGVAFIDILPNMAKFSSGLTSGMAKAGRSITAAGRQLTHTFTIPLALAGGAAVKMSIDFDRSMEQVRTQAGATQAEVNRMHDAVLKLAPAVATGPQELAQGLYHVESVGYRGAKALNVLKTAALGAKVGQSDLEDTASALAAVTITNIKGTRNYSHAMATLNGIIGAGNMRMDEMVAALKSGIVPTAKVAGLSLRGLGAALAMMTDEGVPAQTAANRLRTALFMITNPTAKAVKTLKSIGLHAKTLGHDMLQPDGILVAMKDLEQHLQRLKDPTARLADVGKMFGGSRSGGTIAMLLNNLGRIQMKYQQIGHTSAQFQKDLAATKAQPGFKLDQAWASLQVTLIKLGSQLAPIVLQLAHDVAQLAGAFSGLSPHMQHLVTDALIALAALGPLLTLFGNLMTAASTLTTGLVFIGTGITRLIGLIPGLVVTMEAGEAATIAFGEAFTISLGPIGLAAVAIAGIGIAAAGILTYLSSSSDSTSRLQGVADAATRSIQNLNAALDHSKNANQEYTAAVHRQTAAALAVKQAHQDAQKAIKQYGRNSLQAKEAINQAAMAEDNYRTATASTALALEKKRKAQQASNRAVKADHTATQKLIDAYKKEVGQNNRVAKSLDKSRFAGLANGNAMKKNKAAIDTLVTGLRNQAQAHLHNAAVQEGKGNTAMAQTERHLGAVDTAVANLTARLNHLPTQKQISIEVAIDAVVRQVTGAGPHGYAGNPHANSGKPHRARGGPVSAGEPYIVGEVGPELFIPNVSGMIVPNSALGDVGGGSGRFVATITNWKDGTMVMEQVSDASVDAHSRLSRQRKRTSRA